MKTKLTAILMVLFCVSCYAQETQTAAIHYSAEHVATGSLDERNRPELETAFDLAGTTDLVSSHMPLNWGYDPYGRAQLFVSNQMQLANITGPFTVRTNHVAGVVTLSPKFGKHGSSHRAIDAPGFKLDYVKDNGIHHIYVNGQPTGEVGTHEAQTIGVYIRDSYCETFKDGVFTAQITDVQTGRDSGGYIGNPQSYERFAGGIHELWISSTASYRNWQKQCLNQMQTWEIPTTSEKTLYVAINGDSLSNAGDAYFSSPFGLMDRIKIERPHRSFNSAVPGSRIQGMLVRRFRHFQRADELGLTDRLVIINGGTNDLLNNETPEFVQQQLEFLAQSYRDNGFKVIISGIHPFTGYEGPVAATNALLEQSYKDGKFDHWIPLTAAELSDDEIHPTWAGYVQLSTEQAIGVTKAGW